MLAFSLGFVFGAWLLQQQAVLLPFEIMMLLFFAATIITALPFYLLQNSTSFSIAKKASIFILAVLLGFIYATVFASVRINDVLPTVWEQKDIEVIGVVASMVDVDTHGEKFRFDIEKVITPDAKVPHHIVLNYFTGHGWYQVAKPSANKSNQGATKFSVGERWRMTVKLKKPHTTYNPHGYDFEAWALANNIRAMGSIRNKYEMKKITSFVWHPAYMIEYCRAKVASRISQSLMDKPYAGVIRALVVGDDKQISKHDWDVFLHTGVNHLMSISGLHITMIAGLAFSFTIFVWRRFSQLVLIIPTRKAATIGGAFAALIYACLAGLSIPTQRTLYMLSVFAVALLINRRINILRVLIIALTIVILLDPWAVVAAGFWLSFSAVAIITYVTVNRLQLRHWLIEAINTQWAVTIGLLPFLIILFGQASIVSPIANAFAIPVISLFVVPLSILGALVPIDLILQLAHSILAICMTGLDWLSNLPFATWQQAVPPFWAVSIGIFGMLWLLLPRGFPQRWLGLICMMPMLFVNPQSLAQGEMQVTVLDVGQGLSVVLKTAMHTMVYDTGKQYNQESDAGLSIVVPYLKSHGIQKLDALVISHDDNDHSGGAASVLAQLPVMWTASSYTLPKSNHSKDKHWPALKQMKCYAGQKWIWDGVRFEMLYPNIKDYQNADIKDNNRSCVLKVTSQHGTLLLTGDIEAPAEEALIKNQKYKLKSDVIIVPHHGSKTSSTKRFVDAVAPKYAIFTVGYLNRFKHPKPLILSRYLEKGSQIYRSDHHGAILIDFNNQHALAVKSWRLANVRYWHEKYL